MSLGCKWLAAQRACWEWRSLEAHRMFLPVCLFDGGAGASQSTGQSRGTKGFPGLKGCPPLLYPYCRFKHLSVSVPVPSPEVMESRLAALKAKALQVRARPTPGPLI